MFKWEDPKYTLGERCVFFAENELKNGVSEDAPNSLSSPRIAEYFSICTRLINGKEIAIGINHGNWCAASASYSLQSAIYSGEKMPHGYRVGVLEIMADQQKHNTYHDVTHVQSGKFLPKIGDTIFWDRSKPNRPETAWYRHISRVYSIDSNGFESIGGNTNGKYMIRNHKFDQSDLLGFGSYPDKHGISILNNDNYVLDISTLTDEQLVPFIDSGNELQIDNIWDHFKKFND